MAPDDHDHEHHGGHEPQTEAPPPLLDNATATIYLDGLIYAAYNENRRVLEAAVLTHAEKHELAIEVRVKGEDEPLFPSIEHPWNPDHAVVDAAAPFWLYVDSGNQIEENEFSAQLFSGDDDRTFNNIFNFEDHHHRPLPLKQGNFAVFNFPHGMAYSADTSDAVLKIIPPNETASHAVSKGEIRVSNLAGIDIDAVSNGTGKKSIVLANQDGTNEYFRFDLESGKRYEIKIVNGPARNSSIHGPEGHFLQFYELFNLDPAKEPQFLVLDPEHAVTLEPGSDEGELMGDPPTADNPPCAPGRSGGTTGLGGS